MRGLQLNRASWSIFAATLAAAVGANTYQGLWPFIVQTSAVAAGTYGAFSTIANIISLGARVVSTRLRAAGTFSLGGVAYAASSLVLLTGFTQWQILASLTLSSTGMALVMIGRSVMLGERLSSKRGFFFGLLVSAANIGLILGTNAGYLAYSYAGYSVVFWLGGAISALSIAMVVIGLKEPAGFSGERKNGGPRFGSIRKGKVRNIVIVAILDSFLWSLFMPFFFVSAPAVARASPADVVLGQSLMMTVAVLFNAVAGSFSDRLANRGVFLAASEFIGAALMALYALPTGVAGFLIASVFMGLVISTWGPVILAGLSESTNKVEFGEVVAGWTTLTALARIPGPLIGGLAYQFLGHATAFISSAVLVAALGAAIVKLV